MSFRVVILAVAAGLVTVTVFLFLTVPLFILFDDPFNDHRFDGQVWQANHQTENPNNPRGPMATDVRRRILRTGMSKAQVIAVLGEPDFRKREDVYQYNLGAWSGFRIDYDSLNVYFDSSGRLARTAIVQH